MSTKTPKKRKKAYKPRPVTLDPMRKALMHKSVLTAEERNIVMGPSRESFELLRTGKGDRQAWCHMADVANVGLQLSKMGICSDEPSREILSAMEDACRDIALRVNERKTWTLKASEIVALEAGLDRHEIQLTYCDIGELTKASNEVRRIAANARAGRIDNVQVIRVLA